MPDIAAHDRHLSAALAISGIPFERPDRRRPRGLRQRRVRAEPRPDAAARARSLDMVVAGTQDAVLMVESEAKS